MVVDGRDAGLHLHRTGDAPSGTVELRQSSRPEGNRRTRHEYTRVRVPSREVPDAPSFRRMTASILGVDGSETHRVHRVYRQESGALWVECSSRLT